jgi:hypothetical protein
MKKDRPCVRIVDAPEETPATILAALGAGPIPSFSVDHTHVRKIKHHVHHVYVESERMRCFSLLAPIAPPLTLLAHTSHNGCSIAPSPL